MSGNCLQDVYLSEGLNKEGRWNFHFFLHPGLKSLKIAWLADGLDMYRSLATFWGPVLYKIHFMVSRYYFLSKPQLNHNSTWPNITLVGLDMKMTLHTPYHPTTNRNSMSAISQLLLTRFWWDYKCRFLGTSRTDSNCHGDICPGNICPSDICGYQEYLSC